MGSIYSVKDKRTGRVVYVGQTTGGVKDRINQHVAAAKSGSATPFEKHMASEGFSNFTYNTEQSDVPASSINAAEKKHIASLKPTKNQTKGGS